MTRYVRKTSVGRGAKRRHRQRGGATTRSGRTMVAPPPTSRAAPRKRATAAAAAPAASLYQEYYPTGATFPAHPGIKTFQNQIRRKRGIVSETCGKIRGSHAKHYTANVAKHGNVNRFADFVKVLPSGLRRDGTLADFGYSPKDKHGKRDAALRRRMWSDRESGKSAREVRQGVIKSLVPLMTLNKCRLPAIARAVAIDIDNVRRKRVRA